MNNQLKPCPLCGAEVKHNKYYTQDTHQLIARITCLECGLTLEMSEGMEHIIDKWNTRYNEQQKMNPCSMCSATAFLQFHNSMNSLVRVRCSDYDCENASSSFEMSAPHKAIKDWNDKNFAMIRIV
jgi:Lar family restriction alleviation protein